MEQCSSKTCKGLARTSKEPGSGSEGQSLLSGQITLCLPHPGPLISLQVRQATARTSLALLHQLFLQWLHPHLVTSLHPLLHWSSQLPWSFFSFSFSALHASFILPSLLPAVMMDTSPDSAEFSEAISQEGSENSSVHYQSIFI